MCGLNLMIIPDEIEELIKIYERRGTFAISGKPWQGFNGSNSHNRRRSRGGG